MRPLIRSGKSRKPAGNSRALILLIVFNASAVGRARPPSAPRSHAGVYKCAGRISTRRKCRSLVSVVLLSRLSLSPKEAQRHDGRSGDDGGGA